jgi:hypothetical protein
MLAVRIKNQMYQVTNATLDDLLGAGNWRQMNKLQLQNSVRTHHEVGRLRIDGNRLRLASLSEESEERLRVSEGHDEILRNGLLYVAGQIAALVAEVRSLRESIEFDAAAATRPLARADTEDTTAS